MTVMGDTRPNEPLDLDAVLTVISDAELLDLLDRASAAALERRLTDPEAVLMPTNVVTAIAAVMAEIGGIKKLSQEERKKRGMQVGDQGVTYAYRGIDQIAQAAQPLLGTYCVVIVPDVVERDVKEITVNSKPWTETMVKVGWTIYGPGGANDCIYSYTYGLGRDNSDKGDNKAMTTAFKNLLLRILCIGDPKDDTDQHAAAERDAEGPPAPAGSKIINPASVAQARARQAELGLSDEDVERIVAEVTEKRTSKLEEIYSGDEVAATSRAFTARAEELALAAEADRAHADDGLPANPEFDLDGAS